MVFTLKPYKYRVNRNVYYARSTCNRHNFRSHNARNALVYDTENTVTEEATLYMLACIQCLPVTGKTVCGANRFGLKLDRPGTGYSSGESQFDETQPGQVAIVAHPGSHADGFSGRFVAQDNVAVIEFSAERWNTGYISSIGDMRCNLLCQGSPKKRKEPRGVPSRAASGLAVKYVWLSGQHVQDQCCHQGRCEHRQAGIDG